MENCAPIGGRVVIQGFFNYDYTGSAVKRKAPVLIEEKR